jgi:hypothetical protein
MPKKPHSEKTTYQALTQVMISWVSSSQSFDH